MPVPVLYIFSISHYCEKARWALDYLGVEYKISHVAPGVHLQTAKRLGARRSSLPILVADGKTIQGSSEILDWAEASSADRGRRLIPDTGRRECLDIEKRLDDIAGVHARRYFYSEAVVDYPHLVRPMFAAKVALPQKLLAGMIWGVVRKRMIERMDLGPEQRDASKRIVDGELNWIDGLLADGRSYLVGDAFSRADMTAASLLAPLAVPPQHPTYADLTMPPKLAADLAEWEGRPSLTWVREIYARHR